MASTSKSCLRYPLVQPGTGRFQNNVCMHTINIVIIIIIMMIIISNKHHFIIWQLSIIIYQDKYQLNIA